MCQGTGMETTGEAIVVPEVPRQARLGCAPDTAALSVPLVNTRTAVAITTNPPALLKLQEIKVRGPAPVAETPVLAGADPFEGLETAEAAAARRAEIARMEGDRAEAARVEQARLEQARLAAETARKAEAARVEQARLEQARLAAERARAEEARKAEAARVEQARLEQARLAAETARKAEAARVEQARLAAETARKAEAARVAVTANVQSGVSAVLASSTPATKTAAEVAPESDKIGRLMQIVDLNPDDNAKKIALFNELWGLFIGAATSAPGKDAIKKGDRQVLKRLRTAIEAALSSQGFEANSLRDYIPAWLR